MSIDECDPGDVHRYPGRPHERRPKDTVKFRDVGLGQPPVESVARGSVGRFLGSDSEHHESCFAKKQSEDRARQTESA